MTSDLRGRLGVTTWTLPMRGRSALEWCAEHALRNLHFGSEDLVDSSDPAEFKALADELEVTLAGYAVRELERVGLTDMDGAITIVDRAVAVVNELGVPQLFLPSFGASEIHDSSELEQTARLISHTIENTQAGVASENTLDGPMNHRLLELVGNERACLLFDTQNPHLAGMSAPALAAEVIDLLGSSVHIKDGSDGEGNTLIGAGDADVAATLGVLGKSGYGGLLILETTYRMMSGEWLDPVNAVEADIAQLASLTANW